MKKLILILSMIFLAVTLNDKSVFASGRITVSIDPPSIQANMGDKITYVGTITNNSNKNVNNLIAYISLANVTPDKEAPMDLEDWSANTAIKVDTIPPLGAYEGKWPMRLIDYGSYVAYITVVDKDEKTPVISTMSYLEIKRILRLNPNNVLPVAIGEPVLISAVFMLIVLRRGKRLQKTP
jgi:hypothetical protein